MSDDDFPNPESGFVLTHFLVVSDQDRSRDFYQSVFGAKVVLERDPVIMKLANSWLILNVGGGPTDDKPTVTLTTPADPDRASAFLNIRVADIGASEVGAVQAGANEVRSRVVQFLSRDVGSHAFAGAQQEGIDIASVRSQVQVQESVRTAVRQAFGCLKSALQLTVEGKSGPGGQRLGQVPQQFVELPHDRECVEHLPCGVRGVPPILAAEGDLGHSLARAKAVVHRTAAKPMPPEVFVDAVARTTAGTCAGHSPRVTRRRDRAGRLSSVSRAAR